jgi:hypothetical protein
VETPDDAEERAPRSQKIGALENVHLQLSPIYELNQSCLGSLIELAEDAEASSPFGFLAALGGLLKGLDPVAQRQVAECPFLLLNVEFQDGQWWRLTRQKLPRSSPDAALLSCFPRARAEKLARSALTLAWHMTRSSSEMARLLLGMSRSCASVISSLSLRELEIIAHRQYWCVRPRWEERPAIWMRLLTAARNGDAEGLRLCRVHRVQMMLGQLLLRAAGRTQSGAETHRPTPANRRNARP